LKSAGEAWVVVADKISDPGNLGTILRSAEAAGASAVMLTSGTVDAFSPKVVRASAGAIFNIPVFHGLSMNTKLDGWLTIQHAGRSESLNVAMAATLLCFEVKRQHNK